MVMLIAVAGGVRLLEGDPAAAQEVGSLPVAEPSQPVPTLTQPTEPDPPAETADPVTPPAEPGAVLPHGGRRIFDGNRFLVAYYGTGGTGALGVLGETTPAVMHKRLERAAAPFRRPGQPITPVYELIVTVADAGPGSDGELQP